MHYGYYAPEIIDHIDGNGLNNTLINLRELDNSRNIRKGKLRKNNSSGIQGVRLRRDTNKWNARAYINGIEKTFGCYEDMIYAARVYATAVLLETGENFTGYHEFDKNSIDYEKVLIIFNEAKKP